ncbi:hypothetical protein AVEN_122930-1 [Araneus ventricosus]|uniref:Uncharacterized protein n=1 Tax=Araneus ventricosus TaxID=182803 RepID=A0A4Y2LLH5_ARAVE|nr:hypothetical protein AVEN_122930-1 [Araneus ventricosus]
MVIQAGKSITSCPQLVSVPLTGLERMYLLLSTWTFPCLPVKGFTSDSIGSCGEIRHFTVTWSVFTQCSAYEEPTPTKLEQEWLKRVANNLVSRQKIRGLSNSLAKTEIFLASLAFNFPAS